MRNVEGGNFSSRSADIGSSLETERQKPLYVMKFGGTSMGGTLQITSVVDIINGHFRDGKALVVVPSAMSGVTNLLVSVVDGIQKSDERSTNRDIRTILDKHMTTSSEIRISSSQRQTLHQKLRDLFIRLREDVSYASSDNIPVNSEAKDKIVSYGERMSTKILEAKCLQEGIPAKVIDAFEIIETDDNFGEARPDFENTKTRTVHRINPLLKKDVMPTFRTLVRRQEVEPSPNFKVIILGRDTDHCHQITEILMQRGIRFKP